MAREPFTRLECADRSLLLRSYWIVAVTPAPAGDRVRADVLVSVGCLPKEALDLGFDFGRHFFFSFAPLEENQKPAMVRMPAPVWMRALPHR
jgi:hypothetical protein